MVKILPTLALTPPACERSLDYVLLHLFLVLAHLLQCFGSVDHVKIHMDSVVIGDF